MNYSKALISDFENIKCIRIKTHKMHYDNEPNFFKEEDNFFTYEFFKEKIEKGQIYTLAINQELVGYIIINEVIFENNSMMKDQRILLVEEITIEEKHQKKGYGKEIMKKIEEYARENKYTSIELNVWGFNDNAIEFYKKQIMAVYFSLEGVKAGVRRLVRQSLFEWRLHRQRWRAPRRRPCVVVFPSNQPWDAASNLRAWLIAPELERVGWRVVVVPEPLSLRQRRRVLALEQPDVVVLQQTRNPLNQPHLYAPFPCVLDADDADYLDPKHHQRIVRCAEDAAAVIGGSRFVAQCLGRHNAVSHVLWTCTPKPVHPPAMSPDSRLPVVAWAHASPLAYPHEADFIQKVMIDVCRRTPCTFWLFGTTEAQAHTWFAPVRDAGGTCLALPPMSYDAYLAKVAEAGVGLQPVSMDNEFSQGKSFGKLLAYLAGQVAVVASDAVDHPVFFRSWDNGVIVKDDVQAWSDAIVRLLEDPALRSRMAVAGWNDFHGRLTSDVFARLLDPILKAAATRRLPARSGSD